MTELTKRQDEVLKYIKEYIVSHGYPPTVREIGKDLGVSSPATIHTHLNNLEKKGFIKKDGSKNRALELLVKNDCVQYNRKYNDEKGLVLCTNLVKIISKLYIC